MIASAYNASLPFMSNWLFEGSIVRATSANITGPYEFQNVVLSQSQGVWDENVMNPKIVRSTDGMFLLFYTGNRIHNRSYDAAQGSQRVGMAFSSSIEGPYQRLPYPVLKV